jgi:tRNA 2-selenouridine synthase
MVPSIFQPFYTSILEEFLNLFPIDFLNTPGAILDVRSPAEYAQGHIPGAFNLPLFSDQERAAVGTLYKKTGREEAVELGLELVGPKLIGFVREAKEIAKGEKVKLHCWRGGMRSSSMAWLLETAGMATSNLSGGYKAFRSWVLQLLTTPLPLKVLGGLTGSGKSAHLKELKSRGEQVIDLELLASHRGSSYGHLNMPPQPSCEQFENEIAYSLLNFNLEQPIWIEDESRMVGRCKIPDPLFSQMQSAPLFMLECPFDGRLERLYREYGDANPTDLIAATRLLSKRLGASRTQEIVSKIEQGHIKEAIALTLPYYDAAYQYSLSKRNRK